MPPVESKLIDALVSLRPGAKWDIQGELIYANLVWMDEVQPKPSREEVDDTIAAAPTVPEPGTMPPQLVASALSVRVQGGEIAGVEGVYGLAGAIYLDVGIYMLLFLEPQPDTAFFAVIGGGAPCMTPGEKSVDYLMIEAADAPGGQPIDAAQFNVQIFRS